MLELARKDFKAVIIAILNETIEQDHKINYEARDSHLKKQQNENYITEI